MEIKLVDWRPKKDRDKKAALPIIRLPFIIKATELCNYISLTDKLKDYLKIPSGKYNPKYDLCFCDICHTKRGDKDHYTRGQPANIYVIPRGWRRFGLKLKSNHEKEFKTWHMAFHGTLLKSIPSIVEKGLLIPGDHASDGKTVVELEGHYNDDWLPEGFDTKQIFVSPSIAYSGGDAYAQSSSWLLEAEKKRYNLKVVFQLRIKPGTYRVGPKTVSKEKIDKYIDDDILEWSTKDRDAILITGLLVKLF